jgi:2'-5' RNA ligase
METPEQRLFLALWPPAELQAELARIPGRVAGARGKPPHRKDLHLTLVFLGDVGAERRDCIEQAVGAVRGQPFELVLDRLGYWARPRILWCAPAVTPEPLLNLVRELQGRLRGCGFHPERRPFTAHITLMRFARPQPARELESPLRWSVRDVALVASTLGGPPPRYRVLRRWPLAEGL